MKKLDHSADVHAMEATNRSWARVGWLVPVGAVVIVLAVWVAGQTASEGDECGTSEWPAFMMALRDRHSGGDALGWILWCNEQHWTFHIAATFADEAESRESDSDAEPIFPWFGPDLTPNQAWDRLTGSIPHRTFEPKHREAVLGLAGETANGKYRMEFTTEGIPVRVIVPGDNGFRIWAQRIDRAGQPVRSDADPLNWPACTVAGERGIIDEPQPCWTVHGFARPNSDLCIESLTELTADFDNSMGCSV